MSDALKVKKFVDKHVNEFHWESIQGFPSLVIYVQVEHIDALCDFIGYDILSETGITCILKHMYIVIPHFEQILDYYKLDGEDINEIFPKKDE